MLRWYVARTQRAWDRRAHENLIAQGFEIETPLITYKQIRRGALVDIERPAFPFYLLVRFDLEANSGPRWQAIRSTRGVTDLLPVKAERPWPVPDGAVEDLKAAGTIDNLRTALARWVPDVTKFYVLSGPFAGFVGTYRGATYGALDLLVDVFNRPTPIQVRPHQAEEV